MKEHNRELLSFWAQVVLWLLSFAAFMFIISYCQNPAFAGQLKPVSTSSIEFNGIEFKTRYQKKIAVQTPILLVMDNESRLLEIALKDPASAKLNFYFKITPAEFSRLETLRNAKHDLYFTSKRGAHFLQDGKQILIDEITINIDKGPNDWVDRYRNLIESRFKDCKMIADFKGDLDMVCPPLWIESRITKIERSTLSPTLPDTHVFPHLDYVDIFIEITSIKEKDTGIVKKKPTVQKPKKYKKPANPVPRRKPRS